MSIEAHPPYETTFALRPVRPGDADKSLAVRVYDAVRDAIMRLDLPPGTVLRKSVLCGQLGVSRSPVAEAMARLAAEGLVEIVPQSATRVTRFSMQEIRESAFLREALEVAAVARIAARADPDHVAALRRSLRLQALLAEDGDMSGFFEADQGFHAQIVEFTGMRRLSTVIGQVSLQLDRARMLFLPAEGRCHATVDEHGAIVAAIAKGKPLAAERAMRAHLGKLIKRLEPLRRTRPELFDDGT